MKLIVISSSEKPQREEDIVAKMFADRSKEEPHIVTKMFENGLQTLHLRKASFSTSDMTEYLNKIPLQFHNRIVLHSHHHLVGKFKVKGISLSKRDKTNNFKIWLKLKLLKLKIPKLIVTTSYSRISALFEDEGVAYDYIFLSPIFDNLTGDFISGTQQSTMKSVLERVRQKVIARGGVSVEKIKQVQEIGFAGMAVYSTIWRKPDPVAEFMRFKEKFAELGIPLE